MIRVLVVLLAVLLVALPGAEFVSAADSDELFFEAKVRPLLAAQCVTCHGPEKAESGLRVDSREALLKGGDRGAALVADKPDESLLLGAVKRSDDLKMPPNKPLSPEQIAVLTEWIRRGAPWPKSTRGATGLGDAWRSHWAFQPVTRPAIPAVSHDVSNPVDAFIHAGWKENGLQGSEAADRRTLIRRLSFDLLGIPPTPEEVEQFLADDADDAWERLVDRTLASPRYGERWGRYWLDVARYADNKGYVFFEEKNYPWGYTYRDYVLRSLNGDLGYDRFIREQIAADQYPQESKPESLAAMGFLTIGAHFMGNVHDIADDRIDVLMRGVLGLTVTCARCHDHKYDPVSQADYYGLYGVFRSSEEPLVPPLLTDPPQTDEYRKFEEELAARRRKLDDFVRAKHGALVLGARTRIAEYLLAAHAAQGQPPIDDFMLIADPGDLNPAMIVRWQVSLDRWKAVEHPVWSPWWRLASLKDSDFVIQAPHVCEQLKAEAGRFHPLVVNALCTAPPKSLNEVAQRYGELLSGVDREWIALVEASAKSGQPEPTALNDPLKESLRQELYGPQAPANVPLVFGWGFLSLLPDRAAQGEFQKLLKEVEQWLMTGPGAPPRAMVLLDGAAFEPRVFQRGNPARPGEAVPRRFLKALSPEAGPFEQGSGRRELAELMTSRSNPLTARVIVNRVWNWHFGRALVGTPGDFGLRGDPPTHPELLDWLASEFMKHDWSLKNLHRLILTSATWRQSSRAADGDLDRDPDNRWLARMPRQRLDLEALRDNLIAVTGQLDPVIGGKSEDLWNGAWHARRSLYAFIDRQDLPGILSTFDFPAPAATSPKRDTTTVAPQALYFLNGPLTLQAAERLLQRPDVAALTDASARLDRIGAICFGRSLIADERELALKFLGTAPDAARWLQTVHGLLLTNEFSFVD